MENNPTRERLKKRLKKRRQEKGIDIEEDSNEPDLLSMISQVQKMLKTNPELVNKVSNCVNKLMGNQQMMQQLSQQLNQKELKKEVQKEVQKEVHSQTLVTSSSGDISEAVSK